MITAMSLTNGTLTLILDGGSEILTAREDNPRWAEIKEAFKRQDEDRLRTLLSLKAVVEEYTVGTLSVNATGVMSLGKPIHTVDAERVMAFLRDGLPYQPIANYIERKLKNPSARAINEMYAFLEHKGMPLTPKGTFIAYKGVQPNWYSVRGNKDTVVVKGTVNEEGQILNTVGETIEVLRSSVDDDFRQGCSFGLHAGSLAYARGWGARVVLVEIDPADVVSVPEDCNCQKLRCCKYTVIGEYTGPMPDTYTDEFTPDCPNCGCDCSDCQGSCPQCGSQDCSCEWNSESQAEADANAPIPNASVPPPEATPIPNADADTCPRCQYDKFACICGESAPPNVSNVIPERHEHCDCRDCNCGTHDKETTRDLLMGVLNNFLTPEDKARMDAEIAVEKRVIAQFAEQLGYSEKDIKLTQTGAELGMDSLDGVELAMALEEEFGFEIPDEVAEKYESSTIGEICKGIAEYLAKGKPPIVLQDSYAHGYGVGQADRRNGTPPVFRSGDETAADSEKHRDYIVGYLRGYAGQ